MDSAVLAVITARGGSKRIPRKNVRPFNGQPIIKYSIDAARSAGLFAEVMVSTDDADIAAMARTLGAAVPFMRSAERSNDHATTAEVLLEVLAEYETRGARFSHVCCLYPTAPFVTVEKLRRAWALLGDPDTDSVMTVCPFTFPIWRSLKIEDGRVAFNWPEHELTRSQDLPVAYHDCGQIYFLRTEPFLREKRLVLPRCAPLVMPPTEVQDIDNEEDWTLAELKHARMIGRPAVGG
jgi:N-acylneuraminate cytidylyltransferase